MAELRPVDQRADQHHRSAAGDEAPAAGAVWSIAPTPRDEDPHTRRQEGQRHRPAGGDPCEHRGQRQCRGDDDAPPARVVPCGDQARHRRHRQRRAPDVDLVVHPRLRGEVHHRRAASDGGDDRRQPDRLEAPDRRVAAQPLAHAAHQHGHRGSENEPADEHRQRREPAVEAIGDEQHRHPQQRQERPEVHVVPPVDDERLDPQAPGRHVEVAVEQCPRLDVEEVGVDARRLSSAAAAARRSPTARAGTARTRSTAPATQAQCHAVGRDGDDRPMPRRATAPVPSVSWSVTEVIELHAVP